jgi:hypothetical protein
MISMFRKYKGPNFDLLVSPRSLSFKSEFRRMDLGDLKGHMQKYYKWAYDSAGSEFFHEKYR